MTIARPVSQGYSLEALRRTGFTGGVTVVEARRNPLALPQDPGVYAVFRDSVGAPAFLDRNPAWWFKGKDPTVPISVLEARWTPGSALLYVGKAPGGNTGGRGLRVRVSELVRFGAGEQAGHWGGRYQWQLADSDRFLVLWRAAADPTRLENELLVGFKSEYGRYPFANIAGPRS